jgi:hypothetical protein
LRTSGKRLGDHRAVACWPVMAATVGCTTALGREAKRGEDDSMAVDFHVDG